MFQWNQKGTAKIYRHWRLFLQGIPTESVRLRFFLLLTSNNIMRDYDLTKLIQFIQQENSTSVRMLAYALATTTCLVVLGCIACIAWLMSNI